MQSPTKKLTAPISQVVIEIKDWITASEAEYIQNAIFESAEIKPDLVRQTAVINKFDAVEAVNKQNTRTIEKFIVSINESNDNIVGNIKDLPEVDYNFIMGEIASRRITDDKKKVEVAGQVNS